jgi:hypothetical protein
MNTCQHTRTSIWDSSFCRQAIHQCKKYLILRRGTSSIPHRVDICNIKSFSPQPAIFFTLPQHPRPLQQKKKLREVRTQLSFIFSRNGKDGRAGMRNIHQIKALSSELRGHLNKWNSWDDCISGGLQPNAVLPASCSFPLLRTRVDSRRNVITNMEKVGRYTAPRP